MRKKGFVIAQMLLVSGLALGPGCGSPAGALGESTTLSGMARGWRQGASEMNAFAVVNDQGQSNGKVQIASGSIDASGNFSVTLPGRETLQPYMRPILTFASQICPLPAFASSASDVNAAYLWGLQNSNDMGIVLIDVISPSKHIVYGFHIYVDKDLTVNTELGPQKCDIRFKAGWNAYYFDSNVESGTYLYSSGELPPTVTWQVPS
jgi:hypothetical protein